MSFNDENQVITCTNLSFCRAKHRVIKCFIKVVKRQSYSRGRFNAFAIETYQGETFMCGKAVLTKLSVFTAAALLSIAACAGKHGNDDRKHGDDDKKPHHHD